MKIIRPSSRLIKVRYPVGGGNMSRKLPLHADNYKNTQDYCLLVKRIPIGFHRLRCFIWNYKDHNCIMLCITIWYIAISTHRGRVTHICVGTNTNIGPDNGLSPDRHQAIIWISAGILFIGPLGTNFSEVLIGVQTFSFKKMHLKMSSGKWRPFSLGLYVLIF